MAITEKTKQEGRDTPLSKTPDTITPITDIKSALSDIERRSSERQSKASEVRKKAAAQRAANANKKTGSNTGDSRIHGLASFSDRIKLK